MTDTDLERPRHRARLFANFIVPIVAVVALFGLVAQRVDTNQSLAREAKLGTVSACRAVRSSNDTTVGFLRRTIVPKPGAAHYTEAEAFVDGLAAEYATAYNTCIAGVSK